MTDYISREAFLERIDDIWDCADMVFEPNDKCCRADDCASCKWVETKNAIRKIAANFPAADVREVKRGKWSVHEIYKHEMSYGTTAYEPVYKCSACGNLMESYLRYDEPIMPEDADFPRFCPNCGADMRSADCTKTATADEEREVLNVRAWLNNGADMREEQT